MMKEKILDTFKALGFEMKELEGFGYSFEYEGRSYLYLPNEDDEDFLSVSLPAIWDNDEEKDVNFYQVMDKLNGTLKYVKVNKFNGSMWLFYERELLENEDLKRLLSHMIFHLESGYVFFRKVKTASQRENDAASDVTDDATVTDVEEDAT